MTGARGQLRLYSVPLTLLFLALVFGTGLTAIADGDLFWHLAAGRRIMKTGRLLGTDPFSASALGRPWIDVHWLFQLAVYGVHRSGGYLALVLAKTAVVTAGAAVLARTVEREARWLFAPALVGVLFLARHLLPVSPLVLTLFFLALFFAVLEGYQRHQRPRALLGLPALQIVWVNSQGLAALGPVLVLAYLAAALAGRLERHSIFQHETAPARPLVLALLGCLAASFVSPYGAAAPFVLERTAPAFGQLAWCLTALAGSFACARGRLRLSRLLAVLVLVVFAFVDGRNVLLLCWLGTPIAAMNLAPLLERLKARARTAAAAVAGLALVATGVAVAGAAAREPSLRAPAPFRFPTESARLLTERPGAGTIFCAEHQGGYLIWALHPSYRPYLDGRLTLRTPEERSEYRNIVEHPERFDDLQDRQRFNLVVLPTVPNYLGLVAQIYRTPGWRLVFTDGSEVMFAHDGAPLDMGDRGVTNALLDGLEERFSGPLLAAARLHLAKLDLALGHLDEAERVLLPMAPYDAEAHALLERLSRH